MQINQGRITKKTPAVSKIFESREPSDEQIFQMYHLGKFQET